MTTTLITVFIVGVAVGCLWCRWRFLQLVSDLEKRVRAVPVRLQPGNFAEVLNSTIWGPGIGNVVELVKEERNPDYYTVRGLDNDHLPRTWYIRREYLRPITRSPEDPS